MAVCEAEGYATCRIECPGQQCLAIYDPQLDECHTACGVSTWAELLAKSVRTSGILSITYGYVSGVQTHDILKFSKEIKGVARGFGVEKYWAENIRMQTRQLRKYALAQDSPPEGYKIKWDALDLEDVLATVLDVVGSAGARLV